LVPEISVTGYRGTRQLLQLSSNSSPDWDFPLRLLLLPNFDVEKGGGVVSPAEGLPLRFWRSFGVEVWLSSSGSPQVGHILVGTYLEVPK